MCDDVKLNIEKLKTRHHIFVIVHANHQLIFDQFFLINLNANYDYHFDEVYVIFINFDLNRFIIFKIFDRHDFANRIDKNVFFGNDDSLNLKNRRFYEKTSRFFNRSHLFNRVKTEFEFDLIKIRSSLIINAKRIFIKNVVKKSRNVEKIKFKSDVCLIKILSSLIVNAK
jgi:hypothetical protein